MPDTDYTFADDYLPSSYEIATMSPEEFAAFLGKDTEGFDRDIFMDRFGKFITPHEKERLNLLKDDYTIGGSSLGNQFTKAFGGITSNMSRSAGAEKERGYVLADYAGRMKSLGVGLKQDTLTEYEKQASDRMEFARDLATAEVFTKDYWKDIGDGIEVDDGDVIIHEDDKCYNLLGQEIECGGYNDYG